MWGGIKKKALAATVAVAMTLPSLALAQSAEHKGPQVPQFTNEYVFDQTAIEIMDMVPSTEPMTLEEHVTRLPEAVRSEMAKWLTDYRSTLEDGYRRFKFLEHIIGPTYDDMKLPRELAAGTIITESATRHTAVSPARARGLWQFMRGTARDVGLRIDEEFDPVKSTKAHGKYFQEKLDDFDGDVLLALAAYNAGSGAVRRFLRRTKSDDFWGARSRMTHETSMYSPSSVAIVELLSNPWVYNFAPFDGDVKTETIVLPRPYHLDEASICLGENIWNLENLNPHHEGRLLDKGEFFVYPEIYNDKIEQCIAGEQGRVAWLLSDARNPDEIKYEVVSGDRVLKLARKYNSTKRLIVERNKIDPDNIYVGQTLYIPVKK